MQSFWQDLDDAMCRPVKASAWSLLILCALVLFASIHFVGYIVAALGIHGVAEALQSLGAFCFVVTIIITAVASIVRRRRLPVYDELDDIEAPQQQTVGTGFYVDAAELEVYAQRAEAYTTRRASRGQS